MLTTPLVDVWSQKSFEPTGLTLTFLMGHCLCDSAFPPIIYIVTDISLLARLEGRSLFSFRLRGNGSSIPEERSGRCGWELSQTSFLSQGQQLVKDFKMCLLWSLKTIPVVFPKSSVNTDTNRSRVIKPYECRTVASFQLKPLDPNIPFLPSKTSERLHLFSRCSCSIQVHSTNPCVG